jgi:hypothetical protein
LGNDVTNEYVRDIVQSQHVWPCLSRGRRKRDGRSRHAGFLPVEREFVSNGQRNATAEICLDGALTSALEQGEGATTNVQPSVEIVEEFKVENNSFSSEYGNNGGTAVNICKYRAAETAALCIPLRYSDSIWFGSGRDIGEGLN